MSSDNHQEALAALDVAKKVVLYCHAKGFPTPNIDTEWDHVRGCVVLLLDWHPDTYAHFDRDDFIVNIDNAFDVKLKHRSFRGQRWLAEWTTVDDVPAEVTVFINTT